MSDSTFRLKKRLFNKNEKEIWSGSPKKGFFFQKSDIYPLFFGICWLTFSFYWSSLAKEESPEMAMAAIPLIIIGFYLVFGRFILDIITRANTTYLITDSRFIVQSGFPFKSVRSYDLMSLNNIHFIETSDGSGNILFGDQDMPAQTENSFAISFSNKYFKGIYNIQDVRTVNNKLSEARKNHNIK
ncbi:MAG: hypothetical protein EA412_12055 [Chitinophagaceae bacterium]|nr:MAG: hypothetical protein EA412_12055 [Chitinophagaceae bacterium]